MKKKVGERIRVARVTKGLSQQNMADELGLTVASFSNIEIGVTDITITRLFEIARILQVKIENILDLVNSSQNVKDTGLPYLTKNEIDLVEIRKILADLQEEVKRLKG